MKKQDLLDIAKKENNLAEKKKIEMKEGVVISESDNMSNNYKGNTPKADQV